MELMAYDKAHALLKRYGIRSVESKYVGSADDAVSFSNGKPIVLKVLSQKALHKSRNRLVALNLVLPGDIQKEFAALQKRASSFRPYRVLAQRMVNNGVEIIMGGKTDPQFGKMVLIGLGGVYVEAFRDFALRLCPITRYDARSMLEQLRSRKVIAPTQQMSDTIVDLLIQVSKMFSSSNMTELDLNPVIIHDNTYDAVDLRIIK